MIYKNVKTFLLMMLAVFFLTPNTSGQIKKIVLKDSINNLPIISKTVTIKHKAHETVLQSSTDGIIQLDMPNFLNKKLTFKISGFDSVVRIFIKNEIDTILFSKKKINLNVVEIKGKKSLYEILDDRYIYKVSNDKNIINGSSKEAIKRMPLISIDNNNTILVNGSSNIKLLVDGKQVPNSVQIASYLNSIPLNKIDKIELITDPDERLVVNGTTAVINIILKTPFDIGYFGSVNSAFGTRSNFNNDIDFSAKMPKLSLNINYSFRSSTLSGINTIKQIDYRDNTPTSNLTSSEIKNQTEYNYFAFSSDFFIDSLSNIIFSTGIEKYKFDRQTYATLSTEDISLVNPGTSNGMDFNIDYLKSFKKNKNKLTLSLLYNYLKDFDSYDFQEISATKIFTNKNISHEFSGQSDYSFSVGSSIKMAIGLKFISRGPNNATSEKDEINYSENIPSLYSTFRYNKKKINLLAGLRIENTFFKITGSQPTTTNNYKVLLPKVQLGYSVDKFNIVRLSYVKAIKRPSIALLNDNPLIYDIKTLIVGNSRLKPENIHKVTFNYRKILSSNINTSLGTSITSIRNSIQNTAKLQDSKVLRTYANSGSYLNYEINMVFNATLFKKFSLLAEGSVASNHFKADQIKNKGYSYRINSNLYYTLDSLTQLNSSFSITSNQINLFGYNPGYSYSSISIDRLALKNSMTISLRANDVFKINGRFKSEINTKNFSQYFLNQFKPSVFQVSLSYRFGKEENESSRSKLISNDDLKTKN